MIGLGLFLIVTGVCSVGLGAALRGGKAKGSGKKSQKSQRSKKAKKSQRGKKGKEKEGKSPPPNPMGFFLGGGLFILAGAAFVIWSQLK